MHYEWDENKRQATLAKYGVDFEIAVDFEWDTALETIDDRFDYGETRWVAIGKIKRLTYVMIYTPRGDNIRIISLRKANPHERQHYEAQT